MVIVGLGGCAKDIMNDILCQHDRRTILFFTEWENDPSLPYFKSLQGVNVTNDLCAMRDHLDNVDNRFIVTIGDNRMREKMVVKMEGFGGVPHYFFSDKAALIEDLSQISRRNVIVMRYANVSANVTVKEGAIIYAYCAVAHDSYVGRYTFMSAYSVGSRIHVEDYAFVGLNSVVMPDIRIGEGAVIGACSLVRQDVPANAVAYGNPARIVRLGENPSV